MAATDDTAPYLAEIHKWMDFSTAIGDNPTTRAALDLHQPGETPDRRVICCECLNADGAPADWPCHTYAAIRKAARL